MSEREDTSPLPESVTEDVRVMVKVAHHLCSKSYPDNGRYSVPAREFERLQAKSRRIQEALHADAGE